MRARRNTITAQKARPLPLTRLPRCGTCPRSRVLCLCRTCSTVSVHCPMQAFLVQPTSISASFVQLQGCTATAGCPCAEFPSTTSGLNLWSRSEHPAEGSERSLSVTARFRRLGTHIAAELQEACVKHLCGLSTRTVTEADSSYGAIWHSNNMDKIEQASPGQAKPA